MTLPDCLTEFNADRMQAVTRFRLLYDVIMSRPAHGTRISDTMIAYWSYVPPARGLLTKSALDEYVKDGFLVCVLNEFDELPQ